MIHKTTYIKLLALAVITITCFTTCKKYPENILMFKNPDRLAPFNGYITSYKVNGNDSLDALNKYIDRSSGLTVDIREFEFFEQDNKKYNTVRIISRSPTIMYSISLSYAFSNKKKKIVINCGQGKNESYPPNNIPLMSKNLFVEKGLTWDIIRLGNKGEFKIKTIHNSNTYEITIN